MKNKKIIALAMAVIMLAGCSGKKKADTSKAKDTQAKTAQTETANQEEKKEETTAPQTNSGTSEKKPTGVTSQENIIIIDPEKDVPEEKYELSYADFKSIISVWSNFNNSHISALLIKIQNLDHFICSLRYITSC